MILLQKILELEIRNDVLAAGSGPFHPRYQRGKTRVEIREQARSLGTDDPFPRARFSNFDSPSVPSVRALEKGDGTGRRAG